MKQAKHPWIIISFTMPPVFLLKQHLTSLMNKTLNSSLCSWVDWARNKHFNEMAPSVQQNTLTSHSFWIFSAQNVSANAQAFKFCQNKWNWNNKFPFSSTECHHANVSWGEKPWRWNQSLAVLAFSAAFG